MDWPHRVRFALSKIWCLSSPPSGGASWLMFWCGLELATSGLVLGPLGRGLGAGQGQNCLCEPWGHQVEATKWSLIGSCLYLACRAPKGYTVLWIQVGKQVNLCSSLSRGHLSFQQLSVSPGLNSCRFFTAFCVGTPILGTGAPDWGTRCEILSFSWRPHSLDIHPNS